MKQKVKTISLAIAGLLVSAATAQAGTRIELLVDDKLARSQYTSTITMTDDGIRMDGGGAEPFGVIVFYKGERMVMLQPDQKKYLEFRKDGVVAQYNKNKAKLAEQYEKAFEKMPPDKREMMKNMLPGFKPRPKIKYVKGKQDKVAKYPCTTYKKYRGKALAEELCFTKSKDFKPVLAAVAKAEKISREIYPEQDSDLFHTEYGLPLRTTTYGRDGKVTEIRTLKSYEPKIVFKKSPIEIPKGYVKQNQDMKAMPKLK